MEIKLERGTWVRGALLADGEGGFGRVFHATGADGSAVVAKFVAKEPGAQRELLIGDSLQAAKFRNVVPILDRGEHEGSWVLVMPRADKSLAQHLHQADGLLNLKEALSILSDIATALSDIGDALVHRDLKPENVLHLENKWCLADFGIARYAEAATGAETRKFNLTPPYGAPEQWRSEHATSATDVYAFGVIAFRLLAGKLPFNGPDISSFRDQHLKERPPRLDAAPARLRNLVEECLFKPPAARPTATNILTRLERAAEDPGGPGMTRLISYNETEVQRVAEGHAQDVAKREEEERRAEMFGAAAQSFESFSYPLLRAIEDNASTAKIMKPEPGSTGFVAELSGARLRLNRPQRASPWEGPFDVIAFADISVSLRQQNRLGWNGRSHSLWFCDAQREGHFAWYETAFMDTPFVNRRSSAAPYACPPSDAAHVFQKVLDTKQLAWPVEVLDREDPTEFIDRWIGWFADAAQGHLSRPSTMPEKAVGNFRRR